MCSRGVSDDVPDFHHHRADRAGRCAHGGEPDWKHSDEAPRLAAAFGPRIAQARGHQLLGLEALEGRVDIGAPDRAAGLAFDVVGERRQVDFKVDTTRKTMTEELEVKLRNQKKEKVEVMVKENLYRWVNWNITQRSQEYRKEDSRTVVFPVVIAPEAEVTVRYTVHYSW